MENENWLPARQAWSEFCKANPGLGLSGTADSFIWFTRSHGPAMIAAGVMRKAKSRKLLIDATRFGQVCFEHLTGNTKANPLETIVGKINASIRQHEGSQPWWRIMYSMFVWGEYFATELFGCELSDINPELAKLLFDIRDARGEMTREQFCRTQDFNLVTLEDPENAYTGEQS